MLKRFVYIVESPSRRDFYNGQGEASMLKSALDLFGIGNRVRCAISSEEFTSALSIGAGLVRRCNASAGSSLSFT